MGQSKTSKFYAENPKSAEKRREYQRDLNKTEVQKNTEPTITKQIERQEHMATVTVWI